MNINKKNNTFFWIFVLIVVFAGSYFRLKGLGKWPLAIDEYYLIDSVQNILKSGLPQFNSGGYYERGIIFQYLTAFLMLIGVKAEFAIRIIPVITNILTLIPLYLLTKKISNKILAAIVLFVFCFSVWEVEIARFGRMYAPFQFIFMSYVYFLYKILFENDYKSYKWIFMLSGISILVYEGSIFLVILNFIPIIWEQKNHTFNLLKIWKKEFNFSHLFLSVGLFLFAYLFIKADFRFIGQSNLYPEIYSSLNSHGSNFRFPLILFTTAFSNQLWLVLTLIPLSFTSYYFFKIHRREEIPSELKLILYIFFVLSFLNLFGLVVYLSVLFALVNIIKKEYVTHVLKFLLPVLLVNFIFWSVYAVSSSSWHYWYSGKSIMGAAAALKVIFKQFLNYPYLYETYVLFRDTLPKLTFAVLLTMFSGITIALLGKKDYYPIKFIFTLFMMLLLVVNFLNLAYFETRYFVFLFPLVIILTFSSLYLIFENTALNRIRKSAILIITSAFILLFSEDFTPNHLVNIDSKDINYRVGMKRELRDHYYARWDFKTPAEFINKNIQSNDIVIVNEQINSYYLNKLDYVYRDYRSISFSAESIEGGKKEIWTDANLIFDSKDLIYLLKNNKNTKWLLLNTIWGQRYIKEDSFFVTFNKYIAYTTDDSSAVVYRIPPNPIHN